MKQTAVKWVNNHFEKQIINEDIYASKSSIIESHILFAKWQQERSYSEEEVYQLLYDLSGQVLNNKVSNPKLLEKWFEQFKNK